MRGKILQYNGNDGTGTIVAGGEQHRFALGDWKGDAVPAVGKAVEFSLVEGRVQSVTLVSDDVLMREKASEIGGKLGGLVGGLGGSLARAGADGGGGALAGSIVDRYGRGTLAAYAAFLVGTTMFQAISIAMLGAGWTMFQLAGFLSMVGGGGGIKMLLTFSYLSIAVPLVWRDRRAWLALLLPLLTVVWAVIRALSASSGGGGGSGLGPGDFGVLGFYMPMAAAIYLGLTGFRKFAADA
ncbi:MAG TPA: hypothetical protein VFV65_02330 [Gemmatimonadales bacterium]|nr:hypothetical protein [Gemmatimonadales bacterium]